jgi:hypothetical protein
MLGGSGRVGWVGSGVGRVGRGQRVGDGRVVVVGLGRLPTVLVRVIAAPLFVVERAVRVGDLRVLMVVGVLDGEDSRVGPGVETFCVGVGCHGGSWLMRVGGGPTPRSRWPWAAAYRAAATPRASDAGAMANANLNS